MNGHNTTAWFDFETPKQDLNVDVKDVPGLSYTSLWVHRFITQEVEEGIYK